MFPIFQYLRNIKQKINTRQSIQTNHICVVIAIFKSMFFKSSNVDSLIPDSKIHRRRMVCVVGLVWIVGISSFILFMQSPSFSMAQSFNGIFFIFYSIIYEKHSIICALKCIFYIKPSLIFRNLK